jgi:CheY-like chemotaxis protein
VSHKVLYVEDNATNVQLVERILDERPGIQLLAAGTAAEGLRLAEAEKPALILLDRRLPDMAGEQVLRRLKESPSTAAIPVVVISGDSGRHAADELLDLGASAFLAKPFDVEELLSVIDRFCL